MGEEHQPLLRVLADRRERDKGDGITLTECAEASRKIGIMLDEENLLGIFSHKLAARLAALGWIGPSCLLITPEVGPRVRWVTVLTDAPLESNSPLPDRCADCQLCVKACPPQAFTGRPFDPQEPRDVRFDVHRCEEYRHDLRDQVTGVRTCGMCVYVCPHGQKKALA